MRSGRSRHMPVVIALYFSGLETITVPMGPSRRIRKSANLVYSFCSAGVASRHLIRCAAQVTARPGYGPPAGITMAGPTHPKVQGEPMKAAVLHEFGPALTVEEVARPRPGPD